jgi:peptidoglycan/xylan/chitin deacetylase (PgdA/CDA1 family)
VTRRSARDRASLAVRTTLAFGNRWAGRTRRRLLDRPGELPVLMYHRVLPDAADASGIEPGMFVRASTFGRQIGWLRRYFAPGTLEDATASAGSGPTRAAVTFDDGWRDNLTVAWPILQEHGVRATIFVVRGWVESSEPRTGSFLTPSEVGDLSREGIEFGAHTATHARLNELQEEEIERELRLSREAVEDWTRRSCPSMAYPFGAHDDRCVAIAARLFRAAVVVGGGWWRIGADPHRIPRVAVHEDMTATEPMFEARVAGLA